MSSLNKILNNALLEGKNLTEDMSYDEIDKAAGKKGSADTKTKSASTLKPSGIPPWTEADAKKLAEENKKANANPGGPGSFNDPAGEDGHGGTKKPWYTTDAAKYGGAGLAALGAGLGAVALAKKLRAKKAAAKKK